MENNLSDQIDSYLDNKMTADAKSAFEREMSSNENLCQQVETQKNLRAGIDRLNLKSNISSQFRKMTLKSKIYKWGISTITVAAIATTIYFGYNKLSGNNSADNYTLPTLNEQGKPEWSDADKNLPTQLFSIDPNKDTVLETDGGIVFAVPAGAFLNAKQPVTLEVREALNAADIMKGGLSTTSDGKLLETGGMFYLNARNGDQSLKINPAKPIYANVPANEIKPDMMVFDGERKPDGSINWVNPKKMEKQLIPVDINSLDFYPKGFREKVAELGFDANNKKVTDSIYYSYAGRKSFDAEFGGVVKVLDSIYPPDSETMFKENCSSCHTTTDVMSTGPGLKGVLSRIPGGDWKYKWVHNCNALIASGDKYAMEIKRRYSSMQPLYPKLTDMEIDEILGYCNNGGYDPNSLEINPARISAIWNDKFQNTIIVTKEFEERLQVIFKYGRADILDLYVNNLDKKMYEIDSMAMQREGNISEFKDFYSRHDGGISITDSHMKELQNYFNRKRKAVQEASEKTFAYRKVKEQNEDKNYSDTKSQQAADDFSRDTNNLTNEFNINLTEACRQLGIKHIWAQPSDYYGVNISTTGWCNIDRYLMESTTTRTTFDYTDTTTGKRAVIKYEPVTINISDSKNYDQLTVYLVPDSLNSFMKINGSNGNYSEKLNELFHYDLVVMGEKDGKWFWAKRNNIKPENISLPLEAIDETQLKAELDNSFSPNKSNDFRKEMNVMQEEHDYKIQMKARQKQEEIDNQIMTVIFPFSKQMIDSVAPPQPNPGRAIKP